MRSLPVILATLLFASSARAAGTFEAPSTGYLIPSSGYQSILTDFDGDGLPDIATVSSSPARKIVIFRNLGGRTFAAMDTLVASGDGGIASADLNADGHPDLVAEAAGRTSVWLGNGDFTFGARTDYTRAATSGRGIAAGNLVGDGLPDVVAPDSTGVLVVWRNTGGGVLAVSNKLTISGRVDHVRLADLDHDGDLDIVESEAPCPTCNPVNYQVRVIRNLGGGSFAPGVTYAVGAGWGLELTDLDNDTHPDIVAGAYWLKGHGDGAFDAPALYGMSQEFAPGAGDLNGDGLTDLVTRIQVSNSAPLPDSMVIHVGTGAGAFAPPVFVPTGNSPLDFDVADLDGDNRADVVATCSAVSQIVVHWGDGAGGFGPSRSFDAGGAVERVRVADLTGDGIPDVLALSPSQNNLRILKGTGAGDFTFLQDVTMPASAKNFAVGDFDHDLLPDVAVIALNWLYVYPGLGPGGLGAAVPYLLPATGDDLVAGDVTADGVDDVVVSGIGPGTLSVFAGIADSSALATRSDIATPFNGLTRVAIASSNGDPWPDVVLFGLVSDDVRVNVFPGQPGGTLGPAVTTLLTTLKGSLEHDLADLNGDGAPETISILGTTTTSYAWIYFANLDGTYAVPGSGVPFTISLGRGARRMAYADFDHDGRMDIAACQQLASGAAVFLQQPDGTFGNPTVYGATRQPWDVEAADLNADGRDDLVVGDRLSGQIQVLLQDAPVVTAVPSVPVPRAEGLSITRVWPTFTRRELHVEFRLPAAGTVMLEAFDLAGRRRFSRSLGWYGPGAHLGSIELPGDLAPGLLWLRLRQGDRIAGARAIVGR